MEIRRSHLSVEKLCRQNQIQTVTLRLRKNCFTPTFSIQNDVKSVKIGMSWRQMN